MNRNTVVSVGGAVLMTALFAMLVGCNQKDEITVSAFEIVDRVTEAEKQVSNAENAIILVDKKLQSIDKNLAQLMQAHNNMGNAFAQAGSAQQENIMLMQRALGRIHGKPDWEAALAGARTEISEERKALAEAKKAAEEAKKALPTVDPSEAKEDDSEASEATSEELEDEVEQD